MGVVANLKHKMRSLTLKIEIKTFIYLKVVYLPVIRFEIIIKKF